MIKNKFSYLESYFKLLRRKYPPRREAEFNFDIVWARFIEKSPHWIFGLFTIAFGAQALAQCHYSKFVEFPFKLENNHVVVQGAVNSHQTSIMIDSGANFSALTERGAEKFELEMIHSNIFVTGIGGETATNTAMVREIDLDKYHIKKRMDVLVIMNSDIHFDFMIGSDFLFNQDIEFSFPEKQIRFFRANNCDSTQLGYWDGDVSQTPLLQTTPLEHRQFVIVTVNGHNMTAMLDTGAGISTINLAAAAKAGITPDSPGVKPFVNLSGIGTHGATTWLAKFETFTIGDETIKNATIAITNMWGSALQDSKSNATWRMVHSQPDMILGVDFLKAHRILFSNSQRIFYFSYLGGPVFDFGN